ncbi:MAG: EAL domain-containing protein [Proteobacteria bacterium]|nr:EAL domain-containing protein [Pseudomonadota bacterium]MBU1594114.1 EAL domain-containing protein [Pseudomonadota bacterium]
MPLKPRLPRLLRSSVRNRLVAVFLLSMVATVFLATVSNMYIHLRRMEADLNGQTLAALREAQNSLLRLSRQAETTARHLAGLSEMRGGIGSPALAGLLEESRSLWFLGLVEVFDMAGRRMAASSSGDHLTLGFATGEDNPALKSALELYGSTDYYADPSGLCIKAFAPVLAPGTMQVQGVVVVTYPVGNTQLTMLKDQVRADFALRWNESERVASSLIDGQGAATASGLGLPPPADVKDETSLGIRPGPGGSYAMAAGPLLDNQGRPVATLMALISDEDIRQGFRDTSRMVLYSVALALLLALGLGILLANSFTRPIQTLRGGIQSLALGRLNTRLALAREDELGQLAQGFNEMAEHMEAARNGIIGALEIKESYAREMEASFEKLARFNQELESLVEQRTGELTQRNRSLTREIEERHHAESMLKESEQRFMDILEFLPDATFVIDRQGRVIAWNRAIVELTGVPAEQMLGQGDHEYSLPFYGERRPVLLDLVLGDDPDLERLYPGVVRVGNTLRAEFAVPSLRGRPVHLSIIATPLFNAGGELIGAIESLRDVTERVNTQKKLRHHALHDTLTGLANRALFGNRLDHALKRALRGPDHRLAVLLLDLDHFKRINDTLGHLAGDALLTTVARRLEAVVRDVDTVARLGGDEFVVLLDGIAAPRDAIHIAGRILEDVRHPVQVGESEIHTSASLGIVFSSGEHESTEDLLRDADIAMYRAKDLGRGRYKVFHSGLRARAMHHMTLETELRRAVDEGQFELRYQPILEMREGALIGFEALLRWRHQERGLLPPSEFLAAAEDSGLMVPLGRWVLRQACQDAAAWTRASGLKTTPALHVNLCGRQFSQNDLVETLTLAMSAAGIGPEGVLVEITESELVNDPRTAAHRLGQLRQCGVRVALDDFGTGYSSLFSLQQYAINALKVDMRFVAGLGQGLQSLRVVQAIVSLAAGMGMDVVAEGVETREQRDQLLALGCTLGQGHFFAEPQPLAEALKLLDRDWSRGTGD